jgi:sulfide:quinone oxidoreductase
MKKKIVVLGAGFGGLELCTTLSEALGDSVEITLIDKSDAFTFGFAKLDVLFGHQTVEAVRLPYRDFSKAGVVRKQETVTAIDPVKRKVTTHAGSHDADILVLALGADYDVSETPGVKLGVNEFYTLEGAAALREALPGFKKGHAVIGVCGAPYKCPPAPSECALMLHDHLLRLGVRDDCTITIVNPLSSPVPPSPETSKALLAAFAERKIEFIPNRRVVAVEGRTVKVDDGSALPCDLFLGVPRNRAPDVVIATGLTEGGWVKIDQRTLQTSFPGVYALGDLANTGTPKAGVFAEGAAKTVAANLIAQLRAQEETAKNPGAGSCYIEFGGGKIARVDVDFFSGPKPTGTFQPPSELLAINKQEFGTIRRARWFGR